MIFINKKNDQEKFNDKMNQILGELKELSYIEVLARIAAFNKQAETFQIKITPKKDSNLDEFIRNAGTIADETIDKFKKEILPMIKTKSTEATKTVKKVFKEVKETSPSIKVNGVLVYRKYGDAWTDEHINGFLKSVIRCRKENGLYDKEKKMKISMQYSIGYDNITNKANFFVNQIIKENKHPEVFLDKSKDPLTRAEILRFKFRDVKLCKELEKLPDYKSLSKEDKTLLKEAIKNENKTNKK